MRFLQVLYETFFAMNNNSKKIKISKSETPCIHREVLYMYRQKKKRKKCSARSNISK